MPTAKPRLELTRAQILAFRRRVGALDKRLTPGANSLRRTAWAGLQDSMPRAALLSIHARVGDVRPDTPEDPYLVQIWGPRYNVYVVAARDLAVFTLGRLPDDARGRQRAEGLAARLRSLLDGAQLAEREAGRALGVHPNSLRYASPTGTLLIRWDGARQPDIRTVQPPAVDPAEARLELARRHLRVYGPSTPEAFGRWSGIGARPAATAFGALGGELTPVSTPIGDAWILARDESEFRAQPGPTAPARLVPSGDSYLLHQGLDRELVVPNPARRAELWTPRVWPGGLLVEGEVVGTWRRASATLSVRPWVVLSRRARESVEAEAAGLPLHGLQGPIGVRWEV